MPTSAKPTEGRFEIDRGGGISYLAYETDNVEWISLLYTEVTPALRGQGVSAELGKMAFEYAEKHGLKAEVVCPVVGHYARKHPEYRHLIARKPQF
jgi:predicted GNAT family acetyltransferase